MKHGCYEAETMQEVLDFLAEKKPDIWKTYSFLKIDTLQMCYGCDYYIN